MSLNLRESDGIRNIESLSGDKYRVQKTAFGFGEEITFYDEESNEIESFAPSSDCEGMDGIYEFDEEAKVLVEGMKIRAEFSFSEWYK